MSESPFAAGPGQVGQSPGGTAPNSFGESPGGSSLSRVGGPDRLSSLLTELSSACPRTGRRLYWGSLYQPSFDPANVWGLTPRQQVRAAFPAGPPPPPPRERDNSPWP